MTSIALAWRTAQRYRARTVLAITGVAVIGALLFDMLLLSRGLLLSFADLLNSAGFDVRVVASQSVPSLRLPIAGSTGLADDIRRLPEVERVALIRLESATVRIAGGPPSDITLVGTTDVDEGPWTLVKGVNLKRSSAPADRCTLVVAQPLASGLAIGPGARLTLNARPPGVVSVLPAMECRVVGVAEFTFASTDDDTAATTMEAFQEAIGKPGAADADLVLVASRKGAGASAAAQAIATLRPDLRVFSNEDVVAQFNRNGFAYFQQISFVLSALTMVFAFLLVATLLTVSINQRLGEIASLRALGIGRGRIAAMLLWESALLVGTGGLLALPLGAALAVGLDRILRQMPGLPERLHFFVFEPRALLIHVVLLVITAVAAAAYPIWLTARLPIAATLRREVVG
jgi:putative ABC transport system permease protein